MPNAKCKLTMYKFLLMPYKSDSCIIYYTCSI